MRFIILICCCLFTIMSKAQTDSTREFEATKGSWRIPVDHAIRGTYFIAPSGMEYVCFPGGVSFFSTSNSAIYSLTRGRVNAVLCIGDEQAIIVKYGKYYVTYSGLFVSKVTKGDLVEEGKIIGYTFLDTNGENELEVGLFVNIDQVDKMEEWYGPEFWKFPLN
jgi:hypothetical protein